MLFYLCVWQTGHVILPVCCVRQTGHVILPVCCVRQTGYVILPVCVCCLCGRLGVSQTRGDLARRLLLRLNISAAPHFYNLAALEGTLLCLMHLTARSVLPRHPQVAPSVGVTP